MRNYMMILDMKAGKGPIKIHTDKALGTLAETMSKKEIKHLEAEAWEDFLDMTISQAGVWAANNMERKTTLRADAFGTLPAWFPCGMRGLWTSGPGDFGPEEYFWGYNRMTTINGLFTAGDGCGASGHKFSSGSHAEGRIAGKAMVSYCMDTKDQSVEFSEDAEELAKEIYMPMETFGKYSGYSTDPDINPNYIRPAMFQQRLQIMDGRSSNLVYDQ